MRCHAATTQKSYVAPMKRLPPNHGSRSIRIARVKLRETDGPRSYDNARSMPLRMPISRFGIPRSGPTSAIARRRLPSGKPHRVDSAAPEKPGRGPLRPVPGPVPRPRFGLLPRIATTGRTRMGRFAAMTPARLEVGVTKALSSKAKLSRIGLQGGTTSLRSDSMGRPAVI